MRVVTMGRYFCPPNELPGSNFFERTQLINIKSSVDNSLQSYTNVFWQSILHKWLVAECL